MKNTLLCVFMVALLAGQARADLVDLTTTPYGKIDGAYFLASDLRATGTGRFDPFVRIQAHTGDAEQGYNTNADVQWQTKTGKWTHALEVITVPTPSDLTMPDGTALDGDYWELILDNNQSGNGPISLNELQIYRGSAAQLANFTGAPTFHRADTGHYDWGDLSSLSALKVFDLDTATNNQVYAASSTGSGSGDMFAYIPTLGSGDYLLVYSQFGIPDAAAYPASGGFEEWGVRKGSTEPPRVPAPAAVLLGMFGLTTAGWRLRRFA